MNNSNASEPQVIPFILISLASIVAVILFFKMVIHCYKSYERQWRRIVNPLHIIPFLLALSAFVAETKIVKLFPKISDYMLLIKIVVVVIAIAALLDRIIRNIDTVGLGVNCGCLLIELVMSMVLVVMVYAAFVLAAFAVGIFVAAVIGSSSDSEGGTQYYHLRCTSTRKRDFVYAVNGNKDYLYSVNGTASYTRSGDIYFSDEDNDIYVLY